MRALIFADDPGFALHPLTERSCTALLPVAGKRIVERSIELVADAGIDQVVVVSGPEGAQVRAFLGDGSRWGLSIDHVWASEVESDPGSVADDIDAPWVIIHADRVCTSHLGHFLAEAATSQAAVVRCAFDSGSAGWIIARYGDALTDVISGASTLSAAATVRLKDGAVVRIDSFRSFYEANLSVVSGALSSLSVPGIERALGMTSGRQTRVSPRSLKQGRVLLGQRTRVDTSARFYGDSVIGDDVFIDRRAIIASSVILSNTYVGELLNVENCIVSGADLIDVDSGSTVRLRDAFMLAPLKEGQVRAHTWGALNRVIGIVLFLATLPLWPLAYIAACLEYGPAIQRRRVRGNRVELSQFGTPTRQEFFRWSFSTSIPAFKHLPSLLAVALGHLRLIGVRPLALDLSEARQEDWQFARDDAPSGIVGPAMFLGPNASEDERLHAEGEYAHTRNGKTDIALFFRALARVFQGSSWRPTATTRTQKQSPLVEHVKG